MKNGAVEEAKVVKGVTVITEKRSQTVEEGEKFPLMWINQKQLAAHSISETKISEKVNIVQSGQVLFKLF